MRTGTRKRYSILFSTKKKNPIKKLCASRRIYTFSRRRFTIYYINSPTQTHAYTHTRAQAHAHTYTRIQTHTHKHIHTHTHAYTRIQTHTRDIATKKWTMILCIFNRSVSTKRNTICARLSVTWDFAILFRCNIYKTIAISLLFHLFISNTRTSCCAKVHNILYYFLSRKRLTGRKDKLSAGTISRLVPPCLKVFNNIQTL